MKVEIEKVHNGFVVRSTDVDVPGTEVFETDYKMPALSSDVPPFIRMCKSLQDHFGVFNDKHVGVFINIDYEYNPPKVCEED